MNDNGIRVDSFILPSRNLRIFRLRFSDGATVLSPIREFAVRHLENIQAERLRAIDEGR